MGKRGNELVNRFYNPNNRRPPAALDADDNGPIMEKYIREKYQGRFRAAQDGSNVRDGQERCSSPPPPQPPPKPRQQMLVGVGSSMSNSASSRPEGQVARRDGRAASESAQQTGRVTQSPETVLWFEAAGRSVGAKNEGERSTMIPGQTVGFSGASRDATVIMDSIGGLETAMGGMGLVNPDPWSTKSLPIPGRSASTSAAEGLTGYNPFDNDTVGQPGNMMAKDSWWEVEARQEGALEHGAATTQPQQPQQQHIFEQSWNQFGSYHPSNLRSNNPFHSQPASPSPFGRPPTCPPAIQQYPFTQPSVSVGAHTAPQSSFEPPASQTMDKAAILALYKLAPVIERSSSDDRVIDEGVEGPSSNMMQPTTNNQHNIPRGGPDVLPLPTNNHNPLSSNTPAPASIHPGFVNTSRVQSIRHVTKDSADLHLKSTARHSIDFFASLSYQSR
ncbi:MAG: hypothetical protein M1823_003628 [Watsoniomyces obsoletus]|nr:MAG: hypothetical protein M1823_003628 [Watsoniomyces obsoletus]